MDEFSEDLEYDLTSRLLHQLRFEKELQKRLRSRRNATEEMDDAYSDYSLGTVWVVDDHKVHFRGKRDEKSYHDGRRPGVVLISPCKETHYEVCWIPGSSKVAGRPIARIVVSANTAYLLCEKEWYRPQTLESKKGKLSVDKLLELQRKSEELECDE